MVGRRNGIGFEGVDGIANGCHVVDMLTYSLDQVGILKMSKFVEATGGRFVRAEYF